MDSTVPLGTRHARAQSLMNVFLVLELEIVKYDVNCNVYTIMEVARP
jgi:hypothetical protein